MGDFAGHPFRGNQYQSGRFTDYNEARTNAGIMAKVHGLDVAIRGVKEYGKKGFNISFASKNDSDYARAEIVKPSDPHWTKVTDTASGYPSTARDVSPVPTQAENEQKASRVALERNLAIIKARIAREGVERPKGYRAQLRYDADSKRQLEINIAEARSKGLIKSARKTRRKINGSY